MNNYDITRGYDAIQQGNEDENYIGQGDLQRILQEGRRVRQLSEMQSYNYQLENKGLQKLKPLKDSKYNEYIQTIGDWKNADRLKAAKQTIADKAFNGTVGFAVNTLATFVDNTLGTAAGIVNAGVEGVGSIGTNESLGSALIRGFVTNPITSTMQGLRDWSREVAPIYRTEQLGNRSVGDMLTDPNFWFDDMLVNAGFTVGSMLSMYNGAYGTLKNPKGWFETTKYAVKNPLQSSHALINKIANKTSFGRELSRIELSKKYSRLGKINELVNSVEKEALGKGPVNITPYINYNTTKGKLWNAWKASSGEARMEAYNAYSDFITDQSNALEERYNNDRNKILLSNDSDGQKQIKLEELEQKYNNAKGSLQNKASQLAGFVFAQNKVILTLSNAVDQQFFLRPIIKSKPSLIMRTSESLNKLKETEVKEAINTAIREGNLNAKTLLKRVEGEEAKKGLQAAVNELGGEKAFNELLEKAAETASKTGKEITEVLDSYVNTAAVIDGIFRDTSAKVVRGSVEVAENGEKELIKPGLLRRGFDYAFGNTKSKRQAIIQGLLVKPTQEGWEELAQAWAEQNAKSFYTSEIQAIMNGKENDKSMLNLFDPAGFIGMLNAIFTSMSDDSTGRSLSAESWNTVWNTRWNEGFMGWMTGLLGTVNPAGIYTKRKMRKAAKQRYEAAVSLNKSLKETLHMSDEEFQKTFAERYLEEQNLKKQYEDWSKLKISRDVWSNELFSAIDEANEYEKNMEQSAANAQKFYADTTAVKARIRSVAEALAANRKAEFADLDEDLATTAAQEELLAQISKAYELGISTDFIKKIGQVYTDVVPVEGQDEAETIKAHLQKIGLMEADDTEESTPEPAQGNEGTSENQTGENKTEEKKHVNTVFDNILLDSRDNKIERVNEILRNIRENIKTKAAAYENLRDKLDDDQYDFLSNESKDMIAKALVMHDNIYDDLVKILTHDVTGEMNISLIDILNGMLEKDNEYYKYENGRIYKGRLIKVNGRTIRTIYDEPLSIEDFVKDIIDNMGFTSQIAKKIGEIRSLRQELIFLNKSLQELSKNKKQNKDQISKIDKAIENLETRHNDLINSFRPTKIDEYGDEYEEEREFTEEEYKTYHKIMKSIKKDTSDSSITEKRRKALNEYEEKRLKELQKKIKEIDKKIQNEEQKEIVNISYKGSLEREKEELEEEEKKSIKDTKDRLAKMIDREIEDEYEDNENGIPVRVKTTLERQKVEALTRDGKRVRTQYLYKKDLQQNSQILVNTRLQQNTNQAIERFIYKAMDAYDLHKAIAGALDQGKDFESKLKQYRQRYNQLLEDQRTDEYLSWINQENYLEVYDLLNYLDILYEHPNKTDPNIKESLSQENIIRMRAQIIEKIERDDEQRDEKDRILDKVLRLDQIIDLLGGAGTYFFFEIEPENRKNTIKYIRTENIIERIKQELEKNRTRVQAGEEEKEITLIILDTIDQIKNEIKEQVEKDTFKKEKGGTQEDIEERNSFAKSRVKKERLRDCNTILDKIRNIATIQSLQIGRETMIKREAAIRRLPNLSTNGEISESAFGKPKVDYRELRKKKKLEEGGKVIKKGKDGKDGNENPPKTKEEIEREKREKAERDEKLLAEESSETAQTKEEREVEGSNDKVESEDSKGTHPEETSITEEEHKETIDGKEQTVKVRTRTDGVVNSSRVPAYNTVPLRDEKKLIENEDQNAKIARILYQDFLDSGKLVELIEYKIKQITDKNKNASPREKRQALKTVLMKISTAHHLINEELLQKGIDGAKLNSIIYIAMEIPSELEQKFSKYKNVIRKDGKSYAIIGMYQDNVNQDNVKRLNNEFSKQNKEENEGGLQQTNKQPEDYIKILKYNSGNKQGQIVETSIRTLYSGRIANKNADGKRRIRRISNDMIKHISIFAYTEVFNGAERIPSYMVYDNPLDILDIYDSNVDEQQKEALNNIDEYRGASGCYYALIRANDGRYYRIAIRIARFNKDFLNGNEEKDIQGLDKENEAVKAIDNQIRKMAEKLVSYRQKQEGSIFDVITDERTKILHQLAQIIKTGENEFRYNRLLISEENGNIVLRFSEDGNNNQVIIDENKDVEKVFEEIRDLYASQNFRFKMPPGKVIINGNEITTSSQQLIDTGMVYIDLEGKINEEGELIMFHDSSFDINEVEVNYDDGNIKVKNEDDNEIIGKDAEKNKIERMFDGKQVEMDGKSVRTLGGTEVKATLVNDEIVIEKSNGQGGWIRVTDEDSEEFNLGVNLYTYMLEASNRENQFLQNTWYAIANDKNKVIYYVRTGASDRDKVKLIKVEDIKDLPEEYKKDIERKYKKIDDNDLEKILNEYEKNKKEQQGEVVNTIENITEKIYGMLEEEKGDISEQQVIIDDIVSKLKYIVESIEDERSEDDIIALIEDIIGEIEKEKKEEIESMLKNEDEKESFTRNIQGRILLLEIMYENTDLLSGENNVIDLNDYKERIADFKGEKEFEDRIKNPMNRQRLSALINNIALNNEQGINDILDNKCQA